MPSDKYCCCIPGCKESGGMHEVLHGFPNLEKDRERFNTWLYAIGSDILGLEDDRIISKYRYVCRLHFEDKYLCRNNRISNVAVPTLNMPGRDDEATTSTSTGSRVPRGKNAQYYRDYRARKRAEQEKESLNRTSDPSTTADSSTINVAGSVTSMKRKSAAEYKREYRARKKAKRDNILIDSPAVIPSISTAGFITTHQSNRVDQLTTAGPSTSSDIGISKPTRRKTPAEYQREYRARKKAQRESTRAAKTNDGSMEITDENTSDIANPTRRKTPAEYQREYRARKKARGESTRAAKTSNVSIEITDENTSDIGDENERLTEDTVNILDRKFVHKLTITPLQLFSINDATNSQVKVEIQDPASVILNVKEEIDVPIIKKEINEFNQVMRNVVIKEEICDTEELEKDRDEETIALKMEEVKQELTDVNEVYSGSKARGATQENNYVEVKVEIQDPASVILNVKEEIDVPIIKKEITEFNQVMRNVVIKEEICDTEELEKDRDEETITLKMAEVKQELTDVDEVVSGSKARGATQEKNYVDISLTKAPFILPRVAGREQRGGSSWSFTVSRVHSPELDVYSHGNNQ